MIVSNPRDVPQVIEAELPDAVGRALAAGAIAPLEFIGAGMTGIVLRSGGLSYKAARRLTDTTHALFEAEAEFFAACARADGVREHVAAIRDFDPWGLTITKDYLEPDPDVRPWQHESGLWELHRRIDALMRPHGWTAPEYKPDSYVPTAEGPMLVDGTFAQRVGQVLLQYARALLDGQRPWWSETPQDLAFALRIEVGRSLTAEQAAPLLARLPA